MSLITKISDLAIAIANDIKGLNSTVISFDSRVASLEQVDSDTNLRLTALESNTGGGGSSLTMQEVQQEIARWGVYRDVYAGSGWYKDANGRVYSKGVASGETKQFAGDENTYISIYDKDLTGEALSALKTGVANPIFTTSNLSKLTYSESIYTQSILKGQGTYNVTSWDVGHISNFDRAFNSVSRILGLSSIDVSSVTSAYKAFSSASIDEVMDISSWNTEKLVNAEGMFDYFNGAAGVIGLENLNTSSIVNAKRMFAKATINILDKPSLDLSGFKVDKVTDMSGMFESFNISGRKPIVGMGSWIVDNVTNMDRLLYSVVGESLAQLDLSGWCVKNIPAEPVSFGTLAASKKPVWGTCPYMGRGWYKDPVTGIVECNGVPDGETHQFDDDPKTYICVYNKSQINAVNMEVVATSNVTNMRYAFGNSNRMAGKNLSHWDLSNVTDMEYFADNSNFDGDLSNLHAPLIPQKPRGFLGGTPIENDLSKHPRWGA